MRVCVAAVAVCSLAACDGCSAPAEQPPATVVTSGHNLVVTDGSVRSCQAVFATRGETGASAAAGLAEVPAVVFSDAVTGEMIPRAPRFAVAFVATTSVSGVEVARFQFTRSGNAAPQLVEQRCFDAAGAAVANGLRLAD